MYLLNFEPGRYYLVQGATIWLGLSQSATIWLGLSSQALILCFPKKKSPLRRGKTTKTTKNPKFPLAQDN